MRIIINNNIYDITTFLNEHPGGPDVFHLQQQRQNKSSTPTIGVDVTDEANDIPDLTEKFNEVGHSEYAVNLLGNYKVEELSEDDLRFIRNNKLEYNKTKISKLITHEDKFHIHKIMGCVSLLNYFYLLFDFFYSGADATMTMRNVDGGFIGLTWIHSILSLSALQFLIPRTRTGILPMIWQEFRAHSIIFALRSFLIINAMYFFTYASTPPENAPHSMTKIIIRLTVVLIAMKLADLTTVHLRENKKETTTATMPYWSDCPAALQTAIKYFYTHSQFMATIVCLFGQIPYILAVAFPIQIASFLMTLVRKNIISAFWYHMLYGGSLLVVYLVNISDPTLFMSVFFGAALIYARVNMKLNKYILWTIVALVGGFIKYAAAEITTFADSIQLLGILAIPLLSFYCYRFTLNTIIPTTEMEQSIMDILFDKQQCREESNHRVYTNTTIGKCGEQIHNKITVQLCEKNPKYKPGMYFNLYFDTKKRPYTPIVYKHNTSASNATIDGCGDTATFLIKRIETGEVSPLICDKYLVNNTVFVKGPFGRKYYDSSPTVRSFVCDGVNITAKFIIMCSCGSGITPLYSMGIAWCGDRDIGRTSPQQEIHYLSSYRTRDEAVLHVVSDPSLNPNPKYVKERLFISKENAKLTPTLLIDYLTGIIENTDQTNIPEDIAVFVCGTLAYSQMVKDCCAITGVKSYEW
jgi:ferredoxin-NADP reductase/lipid-A-disaccharide synthase-like uncharacterized protein